MFARQGLVQGACLGSDFSDGGSDIGALGEDIPDELLEAFPHGGVGCGTSPGVGDIEAIDHNAVGTGKDLRGKDVQPGGGESPCEFCE